MLHLLIKSLCPSLTDPRDNSSTRVDAFFRDLSNVSDQIGPMTHAVGSPMNIVGYAQLHRSRGDVKIHRLWTVTRGHGNGSKLLRTLCDLADRHGVPLRLKVVPFGEPPFPMSVQQLRAWYQRYYFHGEKQMIRPPLVC